MRPHLIALAALAIACGAAPPLPPSVDADPVRSATRTLLRRQTVAALAAAPLAERAEVVYHALYNQIDGTKPRTIDQAEYERRLAARADRAETRGPWHVRWGLGGTADLSRDARRIYVDVVPDAAPLLADEIAVELDRLGVRRYSFKVLSALETFDIPVPAVLYLEAPDYEIGRDVVLAFARAHPEALWPEEPPLTQYLAPGISTADEIGDVGPAGVAGNSFAGAMAHLFALALEGAPPDLGEAELARRMREALRGAGFDPERPWLRPGHHGAP